MFMAATSLHVVEHNYIDALNQMRFDIQLTVPEIMTDNSERRAVVHLTIPLPTAAIQTTVNDKMFLITHYLIVKRLCIITAVLM